MNGPNLFIIGAMKAGTTSLHHYLDEHPDIFMTPVKEPDYFAAVRPSPQATREYLALFAASDPARWRGEASTSYSKLPAVDGVAQRVYASCPQARIIYQMRDPLGRAVSHYWHEVRRGRETRPIDVAVRADPAYFDYGDYARQLTPWFEVFGRDQVLLTTYEAMVDDPRVHCAGICRWLGVAADLRIPARPVAHFATGNRVVMVGNRRLNALLRKLDPVAVRIPAPLRKSILRLAGFTVRRDDARQQAARERAHAYLKPLLLPRVRELEALCGRRFDEWRVRA